MDEKDLRRQIEQSEIKRAMELEKARIAAERRSALLTKAIQQNKVRVNYQEVDANYDPRARFEAELRRSLSNNETQPSDDSED